MLSSITIVLLSYYNKKKWQYFENLNLSSSITDNMLFWKTVSPLFTEENGSKNNKITLAEGGKVLTDMQKYSPLN